jgi:hypothetical protein
MTADDGGAIAAESMDESVVVVGLEGPGSPKPADLAALEAVETGTRDGADAPDTPDVVVLAADASRAAERADDPDGDFDGRFGPGVLPDAELRVAVVTVPDRPTAGERAIVEALSERAGTVLFASERDTGGIAGAVGTLVSLVREAGIVNVDLADLKTVFRTGELAALGVGTGPLAEPVAAVESAFRAVPRAIETDPGGGVIVDVVGPPETSVTDTNAVVSAVRGRVGPDAHVIWGGAVDASRDRSLKVRLAVGGVGNARVAPGDGCPRCGTPLSVYDGGGRRTLSCEACGFADVSVRHRG